MCVARDFLYVCLMFATNLSLWFLAASIKGVIKEICYKVHKIKLSHFSGKLLTFKRKWDERNVSHNGSN